MIIYFVLDLTSNNSFDLNQIDDYETGCSSSSSTYVSNKKSKFNDRKSENTDGTSYSFFLLLYLYLFMYVYIFLKITFIE